MRFLGFRESGNGTAAKGMGLEMEMDTEMELLMPGMASSQKEGEYFGASADRLIQIGRAHV